MSVMFNAMGYLCGLTAVLNWFNGDVFGTVFAASVALGMWALS